jgi:SMI1 / KNR4 family (SUKH-1)
MSNFDWESFLKRWSQEMLESVDRDRNTLPVEVAESGWLGYLGATDEQIARAETRLGITLPPSYRAFLKVTNGWQHATLFINKLWSTEEIEWFNVRHPEWIDALLEKFGSSVADSSQGSFRSHSIPDDEYFVYGDEQDCSKIRVEYLQQILEISPRGEAAIYLLNPHVVTEEGEWEAWFLGDWLPGADRYRSFQDMMQAEYESFLELREVPARAVALSLDSNGGRNRLNQYLPAINLPSSATPEVAPEASAIANYSQPGSAIESGSAMEEEWRKLASFTVEIQAKPMAEHSEQRMIVRHVEAGTVATYPSIDPAIVQQWISTQLKATLTKPVEHSAGLEITQLQVIRAPYLAESVMVVDQANPVFLEAIRAGEPFSLEVSMKVIGSTPVSPLEQQLTYRTQCLAHNLSTKLNTCLGDVITKIQPVSPTTYTTLFPKITLQHPGIYRLKVWVMVQNSSALPSYFKVPMLQVV